MGCLRSPFEQLKHTFTDAGHNSNTCCIVRGLKRSFEKADRLSVCFKKYKLFQEHDPDRNTLLI